MVRRTLNCLICGGVLASASVAARPDLIFFDGFDPIADGAVCSVDGSCEHGHCVSGICCAIACDDGIECTRDLCVGNSECRHVAYDMCGSAVCNNPAAIAAGFASGGLADCQSNPACINSSIPESCTSLDSDGDGFSDAQEDVDYIDRNCNGVLDADDLQFPHADFTAVAQGGTGSSGTGLVLTNRSDAGQAIAAAAVTVTITSSGQAGTAQFSYSIDGGPSIGPAATGTAVDIADNIRLAFANGPVTPSFVAGNTYEFAAGDFKVADKNVPNIYLQYDYMDWTASPSHACTVDSDCAGGGGELFGERCHLGQCNHNHDPELAAPGAVSKVVAAYAGHGIALYVDPIHKALPHSNVISWRTPELACEGADVPDGVLGAHAVNFFSLKDTAFEPRRQSTFHYAVFAHYSGCDFDVLGTHCNACPNAGPPGRSGQPAPGQSGMAELPGNDFIVSLANYFNDENHPTSLFNVGGTFMHELGHNVGLRHGGDADAPGYKPNYLSVMNYGFQFTGIAATDAAPADPVHGVQPNEFDRAKTRLDYSEETLATLDEVNDGITHPGLTEAAGLACGGADSLSVFQYSDDNNDGAVGSCTGPVNWDIIDNDVNGTGLQVDLNQADHSGSVVHTQLTGHTDWGAGLIAALPYQCTAWGSADGAAPFLRMTTREQTPALAARAHTLYLPRSVSVTAGRSGRAGTAAKSSRGEIALTILGSDDLEVEQIDLDSLKVQGAWPLHAQLEDLNQDGRIDLVVAMDATHLHDSSGTELIRISGWFKNSQRFVGAISASRLDPAR